MGKNIHKSNKFTKSAPFFEYLSSATILSLKLCKKKRFFVDVYLLSRHDENITKQTMGIKNMLHFNPPFPIVHWASTHQQQPSHSLNLKPHEIDLIPSWYCCWCYILKPCSQQAKGDCFDLAEKWVLTYFCWNTRLLSEEMTECLFRGSRSNASKCLVGFPISFVNVCR